MVGEQLFVPRLGSILSANFTVYDLKFHRYSSGAVCATLNSGNERWIRGSVSIVGSAIMPGASLHKMRHVSSGRSRARPVAHSSPSSQVRHLVPALEDLSWEGTIRSTSDHQSRWHLSQLHIRSRPCIAVFERSIFYSFACQPSTSVPAACRLVSSLGWGAFNTGLANNGQNVGRSRPAAFVYLCMGD